MTGGDGGGGHGGGGDGHGGGGDYTYYPSGPDATPITTPAVEMINQAVEVVLNDGQAVLRIRRQEVGSLDQGETEGSLETTGQLHTGVDT